MVFPTSGLVQGLRAGECTLRAEARRAEASTRGSASGPRGRGQGPAQEGAPGVSAGAARPLPAPRARGREMLWELENSGCPGSPPWADQGPRCRPGALLGRALQKSAGGETAEAKRRQLERPGQIAEEGPPCSTGPSPSWPGPPGLGRLCPGTQHHSSPSHSRPPSFWAAITGPPEKS